MFGKHPRNQHKRGTATVELAVCLPVIIVLVFGALECTTMIFVKQSLHVVAYEAARVAVKDGGDNATATTRANAVIAERELQNAEVEFSPANVSSANSGDTIEVTVRVSTADNSLLPLKFFSGELEASAVMYKE